MTTRVVLAGATGRLGSALATGLAAHDGIELVALVARGIDPDDRTRFGSLGTALDAVDADVLLDVTHAEPALAHARAATSRGVHVVLGATGMDETALDELGADARDAGLGLLVVPNFSLGVVLAMRVAEQLAAHFDDVEVVEMHHEAKRDSPSGTAVATARRIAAARSAAGRRSSAPTDGPGRGHVVDGVPVHAQRLRGATAHQTVTFGAPGELLVIRHDAMDRSCYVAGAARAVTGVRDLRGLHVGLDAVL